MEKCYSKATLFIHPCGNDLSLGFHVNMLKTDKICYVKYFTLVFL